MTPRRSYATLQNSCKTSRVAKLREPVLNYVFSAQPTRYLHPLACHSARRFGDHLPEHEQQQILRDLDTIPWAPTCPHGRPVAVAYSLPEIERRFARR